ncbi:MAG: hypothetical protein ACLT3Y_08650 [Ruminococcus callidus]
MDNHLERHHHRRRGNYINGIRNKLTDPSGSTRTITTTSSTRFLRQAH